MPMDDMNNLTPESQEPTVTFPSLLTAEQSRRRFLRTAVIGTAGVAGAAGVAGVILSQRGTGPNLMVVADISGVSQSHFHALFEDSDWVDYSSNSNKSFTINNSTSTSPGSWFIVLGIQGLPADTYTISAVEKLSTAGSYSNIPDKGSGTASLPFEYQSPGGLNGNINIYTYTPGTISSTGPYTPSGSTVSYPPLTTSAAQDVVIFIHVNWNTGGSTETSTTTETIDFQISITDSTSHTVTETITTTGTWA
ncbi:MAG TPA: twin-arginine translocation signal domain-containing protein [Ktedonobacterales bacterium]